MERKGVNAIKCRTFIKQSGLLLAGAGLLSSCGQSKRKPNVLFVLVDDLGWKDLGCYGSTFYETPHVDQLARDGIRFNNAYAACPVCSPTRASIMTGKYPARIHLTDWIPGRQNRENLHPYMKLLSPEFKHHIELDEVTIAEALREAGYSTGFFGKWHCGEQENYWPEHQGFDVNIGGWKRGAPYYRNYDPETDIWSGESGYVSPYRNPRLEDGPPGEYLTDCLTDEAIQFIEQYKSQAFFVCLSFYTVHNPLHGKQELVDYFKIKAENRGLDEKDPFIKGKPWMDRPDPGLWRERVLQSNAEYAAMVYSMDENVGRVLSALRQNGLYDDTVIIFMADNGGLSTNAGSPTCNLPLRAGKGWLYEGGIRVPMIIRWPSVGKHGVCHELVTSTDFYSTILEMTGQPLRPEQHADGVSLAPLLKGEVSLERKALYWHYPHYSNNGEKPGGVVRCGDYKLIEYYEDMHVELYHLKTDIGETTNLAETMPDQVEQLQNMLHTWRESMNAQMPRPNPDYDP